MGHPTSQDKFVDRMAPGSGPAGGTDLTPNATNTRNPAPPGTPEHAAKEAALRMERGSGDLAAARARGDAQAARHEALDRAARAGKFR
jgi:hypothetical protein